MTKTISKSGKKRSAGVKFHGREGGGSRLEKRGLQRDWQQVVEITEVRNRLGIVQKNEKGKVIHQSITKHVPR